MWVMPSSSARCAQLPRAADKVPFYAALKKFRDHLNLTGAPPPFDDDDEFVFSSSGVAETDGNSCTPIKIEDIVRGGGVESDKSMITNSSNNGQQQQQIQDNHMMLPCDLHSPRLQSPPHQQLPHHHSIHPHHQIHQQQQHNLQHNRQMQPPPHYLLGGIGGSGDMIPGKKKRGRPKKIRILADGLAADDALAKQPIRRAASIKTPMLLDIADGGDLQPKKKRGRPKKVKDASGAIIPSSSSDQQHQKKNAVNNGGVMSSSSSSPVRIYFFQFCL